MSKAFAALMAIIVWARHGVAITSVEAVAQFVAAPVVCEVARGIFLREILKIFGVLLLLALRRRLPG